MQVQKMSMFNAQNTQASTNKSNNVNFSGGISDIPRNVGRYLNTKAVDKFLKKEIPNTTDKGINKYINQMGKLLKKAVKNQCYVNGGKLVNLNQDLLQKLNAEKGLVNIEQATKVRTIDFHAKERRFSLDQMKSIVKKY